MIVPFVLQILALQLLVVQGRKTVVDTIHFEIDDEPKSVGDTCSKTKNGSKGICTYYHQCKSPNQIPWSEKSKEICFFEKHLPIICCPPNQVDLRPNAGIVSRSRISATQCTKDGTVPRVEYFHTVVVGGSKVRDDDFPFMVGLLAPTESIFDVRIQCGGTLISDRFVITAAHCFNTEDPKIVIMGIKDLKNRRNAIERRIEKIFLHPDYRPNVSYNDIALVKLNASVPFSNQVRPACLWNSERLNNSFVRAAGWGDTSFLGSSTNDLMEVTLEVISNRECQKYFPGSRRAPNGIVDSQLCAGELDKDTCQGDSGGPLTIKKFNDDDTHHNYLVGVTSFGKGCAQGSPGVYTNIAHFLDWIEGIVWF